MAAGDPMLSRASDPASNGEPDRNAGPLVHRIGAAGVLVLAIALVVGLPGSTGGVSIRVGEPAAESIVATREVRVVDETATETARRVAAESLDAVLTVDAEAGQRLIIDLRDVFAAVRQVREPVVPEPLAPPAGRAPGGNGEEQDPVVRGPEEQLAALGTLAPELESSVLEALVATGVAELEIIERETISIAQLLARQRIREEALAGLLADTLTVEFGLRALPGDTGETIVAPLLRSFVGPNVVVDLPATVAAREFAAASVSEISQVWLEGQVIVRQGEIVGALQAAAITRLEVGRIPLWRTLLTAAIAALLLVVVAGIYLSRMQPRVWGSPKRLWLLTLLLTAFTAVVVALDLLVGATSSAWAFALPVGALAILVALLVHHVVGLAMMLPAVVVVGLVGAGATQGIALFAAAAVLVSVPLTRDITSRADLQRALLRSGLSYPALAVTIVIVFGPREQLLIAIAAGALNGLLTALIVQGALPYLETLFRLPTVTALLDLADRNHPLLRELEVKALGSYNHSVMVASLTERACRAIGADPLLGSVAALYHDIGKVRQPHFFIENQQGIANPHDGLDPEVSALIIMNHVVDGIEMATSYRLPPEVVACIGSHHGTMLVKFFYEEAVRAAGGDHSQVDEATFRYRGDRPRSREAAVLLLADSCEATTRAMAMDRGTLPREEIEGTVDRLLAERLEDGQFDDAEVTLRDLRVVRDTIIESLVGIYHPRIAYPSPTPRRG